MNANARDQIHDSVQKIIKSRADYAHAYALGFVESFLSGVIEDLPAKKQKEVLDRFIRHSESIANGQI